MYIRETSPSSRTTPCVFLLWPLANKGLALGVWEVSEVLKITIPLDVFPGFPPGATWNEPIDDLDLRTWFYLANAGSVFCWSCKGMVGFQVQKICWGDKFGSNPTVIKPENFAQKTSRFSWWVWVTVGPWWNWNRVQWKTGWHVASFWNQWSLRKVYPT